MSRYRKKKRLRFYIGCEGQSEVAYVGLLLDLCEASGVTVAVESDDLSSGDPLSRVREAIRRIKHKEMDREAFKGRFVLLDSDQADANVLKAQQAIQLADENGVKLVWQRPCHEGLLLRHFAGHENDVPANSALAERALRKAWLEYSKPMDKRELSKKIGIAELARVAAKTPELANLITTLGLELE
ncbi:MAG: RloB domain-containing protein [Sphingorhabdus sp.]